MKIIGVDSVVYGVEDMAECTRFCDDFGLIRKDDGADGGAHYECLDGSSIVLRAIDDPALPAPTRSGSTLRELVWGVEDEATLEAVAAELGKDREVHRADGVVRSRSAENVPITFRIAHKRKLMDPLPVANVPGHAQRPVNSRGYLERAVTPRGIAHVVFDCADELAERAFYMERLGFKLSDSFRGAGAFLRTAIASEHHSLFTLKREPAGLNHVAFYLTDFHEVMLGGKHMAETGWATRWGPGRHKLGSNYFWYFHSPLGGAMEYTCDVDHVDDDWVPSELEMTRENAAIWSAQYLPTPV